MKLIQSLIVAAAFAIPAVSSFAQSDAPVSRAQVRAELVQLEQAGYQPGAGDQATYPVQIQAAEARVTAQNNAATGYGGVSDGSSSSGASLKPTANIATKSIYSGH
jgi:type II secretory pathway pseudopilin PulG